MIKSHSFKDLSCHQCVVISSLLGRNESHCIDTDEFKCRGKFLCTSSSRGTDYIFEKHFEVETLTYAAIFDFDTMQESGNLCNTLLSLEILNIHHLLQRVKLRYSHLPVIMLLCYLIILGSPDVAIIKGWLFELDVIL